MNLRKSPPEIIEEIFEIVIFPRWLLPFTHRPLLHSAGHPRPKLLPLIRVCKPWYNIGLPLLYRDILITRLSQLNRLLETLEETECTNFRFWIRAVEIRDVLPEEINSRAFHAGIRTLLTMCPNLTTYAYQQSYRRPWGIVSYPSLLPPITHLHLQWMLYPNELVAALKGTAGSLQSLYMSFADRSASDSWPSIELSLPLLDTLALHQDNDALILCQKWSIPNLTRLFLWSHLPATTEKITEKVGEAFFKRFGSKLTVLEFFPNPPWNYDSDIHDTEFFTNFTARSPALEHIIIHQEGLCAEDRLAFFKSVSHPTVKWIDIWAEIGVEKAMAELEQLGLLSLLPSQSHRDTTGDKPVCFPGVLGIRIFPAQLASWNHLPLIIPPSQHEKPQVVRFSPATEVINTFDFLRVDNLELEQARDSTRKDRNKEDFSDCESDDSDWDEALKADVCWDNVLNDLAEEELMHKLSMELVEQAQYLLKEL